MPFLPGVQGYSNLPQQTRLCIETAATPGEQLLMALTTGSSTMSLTTQPNTISPTTGMHLHFYVFGNPATGSVVITGTNPAGGAQTSITYHVPVAPQNGQGFSEFTTTKSWATVTSSSIAVTGLTPCQIMVWGSFAGKILLPITSDSEEQYPKFSPDDHRGILFRNFRIVQLAKNVLLAKCDCATYPDSLWAYYMLIGKVPVVTTAPVSPPTLLASTAKASTMTLTTLPTAPGMFFIFAIGGTNILSGTIVLSGLDNYGYPASETITVSASGPQIVYSTKRYSALTSNQFTTTGLTSGATIAVTGVFAWIYTFTYDGINNYTPYSASLEVFNGVYGIVLPGTILTEGLWSWSKEKSIDFTSKGECQDYLIVGDNSPTSAANYLSGVNPFPALTQPTSLPIVSWPSSMYIDQLPGSTPFATQDGSLLTLKIGITSGRKWEHTGDGQQRPTYVTWKSAPDFSVSGTMLVQNYQYYNQLFKPNAKFALGAFFQGNWLGTISSTSYYEGI